MREKLQQLSRKPQEGEDRSKAFVALSSKEIRVEKVTKEGKDKTVLTVPVQSLEMDRDGDIITEQGQDSILKQLEEGKGIPAFPNHGWGDSMNRYDFREIMGAWTGGFKENGVTFARLELRENNDFADNLLDLIEQDMPVGFSIGFIIRDMEPIEGDGEGLKINDLDLLEISPVGVPSNPLAVNNLTAGDQVAILAKNFYENNKSGRPDDFVKAFKEKLMGDTMPKKNEEDIKEEEEVQEEQEVEEKPTEEESEESEDEEDVSEEEEGEPSTDEEEVETSSAFKSKEDFKSVMKEAFKEALKEREEEVISESSAKSPENVERGDILSFTADHFNGVEITDLEAGIPDDAEYIGQLDLPATANLFATAYEVNQGDVMSAMEEFIAALEAMGDGEGEGDEEEDEMDDDEEEESELSTTPEKSRTRKKPKTIKKAKEEGDNDSKGAEAIIEGFTQRY